MLRNLTHRLHRDPARGGERLVEEWRGGPEDIRYDSVGVATVDLRHEGGGLALAAQQIPHRIRVLLAIQAMQGDAARIFARRSGAIQGVLHPAHERAYGGRIRLRISRWRHEATAQLTYRVLPRLRLLRNLLRGHGVER